MVEIIILGVVTGGLGVLVYYTYNSMKTIEKKKQEELDKEILAGWENFEKELVKED
jgi:hypothetical protein